MYYTTQLVFNRRTTLSLDECQSSRGYYDVCLGDEQETEPIEPGGRWGFFRPIPIAYDDGEFLTTIVLQEILLKGLEHSIFVRGKHRRSLL